MSSCTLGVAVAVRATIGILLPNRSIIVFIFRYSGRKSCPHSEIQCASSTATNDIGTVFKKLAYSSLISDSGATYSNLVLPLLISSITSRISFLVSDELSTCAILSVDEMPRIASTWFFIRAIRGEITMAVPSKTKAGSW